MHGLFKWINKRFGTFDLLPEYFTAAGRRMQDVLWGALLPFLAWGLWFIVSTPPTWINVTAVGLALFMAGYYVWRADHIRLIPRLDVTRVLPYSFTDLSSQKPAVLYAFEVANRSETESIQEIHVQLAEIVPAVSQLSFLPVPLRQKHDNVFPTHAAKHFDLNPGQLKHIDLISAFVGGDQIAIYHLVAGVQNVMDGTEHRRLSNGHGKRYTRILCVV